MYFVVITLVVFSLFSSFRSASSWFIASRFSPSKRFPVEDAAAERHLVRVVELVVLRHAARNRRDGHIVVLRQLTEDVEVGGVTLHRGAERQDDLGDVAGRHALHQALDLQILRPDAVHGGDDAAQDMIDAVVLLRRLDGQHILDALHDAHRGVVALRRGADAAHVAVADVVAHTAVAHVRHQLLQTAREGLHVATLALQQMQHEAHRRLTADARQL